VNEAYAIIGIGICIMLFLLVLLGIGEFYGGDWNTVAQGVAKFILLIVGFAFGAYVLVKLLERR
jgi:hypothetical protein